MKILVVDDDREIVELLTIYLKNESYEIVKAYDGKQALEKLKMYPDIDMIILDIMMPRLDGISVVHEVRKENAQLPILLLSAKSTDIDKIQGLTNGADDYVTKPFNPLEVIARVKSLLRRPNVFVSSVMTVGNVELNRDKFTMQSASGQVLLNNKEFQLMEYFMMNSNQVLSTELIMEKVWGLDSDAEINVVWVNISSLRKKLASIEANVTIKSARGLGYQLMVEA